MKKTTIKGEEYYECICDIYFNSSVSKYIKSQKLIEDTTGRIPKKYCECGNKIKKKTSQICVECSREKNLMYYKK